MMSKFPSSLLKWTPSLRDTLMTGSVPGSGWDGSLGAAPGGGGLAGGSWAPKAGAPEEMRERETITAIGLLTFMGVPSSLPIRVRREEEEAGRREERPRSTRPSGSAGERLESPGPRFASPRVQQEAGGRNVFMRAPPCVWIRQAG